MKKKVRRRAQESLPTEKSIVSQTIQDHIILFYGPPGVGKTTFVNDLAESVLFLSTDRGTRHLMSLRKEVHNYQELNRTLKALESGGADNYDIICLDHVDDIVTMVEEYVCQKLEIEALGDVGYAKGWRMYKKEIWSILQRLLRLKPGLGLIAHETIKTVRTKVLETERIMPDLSKSAWKVLIPACDLVGYCELQVSKRKGTQTRVVRTEPLESVYAKDRTTRKKPEEGYEPLDGAQFAKTFERSSTHGKKKKKVSRVRT